MKQFLDKDFLLHSETAKSLYHEFAAGMPIIDYHCHLPPDQIANDLNFKNITQIWLNGDHYKWRAMRTNGVKEDFITGNASDEEKFLKWAETVPYTLRNPLYHWTHLELQRYFEVNELLDSTTAKAIYEHCNQLLQKKDFSVRNLLRKMNVKVVCTTDDPLDNLEHHKKVKEDGFEIKILPAFRPDKAMYADDAGAFIQYVKQLEKVSDKPVSSLNDYLEALKKRHDFFASMGCNVSDHGLEHMYAENYTEKEVSTYFETLRSGHSLSSQELNKFKSALLYQFALWDHEKGWIQQFHLGAIRNNNTRMLKKLGPDTGWDSIGDFNQSRALSHFLNRLDETNQLTKTILYNLNPSNNELMATMCGNFNDGSFIGKIQFGAAWWFLDQKDGMTKQINALSNMGLLSRFVGMLTDSRSFLSYPRHEYFRRLLCNIFGEEVESGELPNNIEWIGKIIQNISYNNAADYFNWK